MAKKKSTSSTSTQKRYGVPVTELERSFLESLINGYESSTVVTAESSLQVTTAFACIRVLADAISTLPLMLYRRTGDGEAKERARDNPLYRLVHDVPNNFQTSDVFRSMLMCNVCLWGNAYAQVLKNGNGQVLGLIPVHPTRVRVLIRETDGSILYEVREKQSVSQGRIFQREEMVHLRWISLDGVIGYSPITLLRAALELSMNAEKHGSNVFKRGGALKGVLEYPTELTEDAYKRLIETWEQQTEGVHKSWATPILEAGLKFTPLGQVNSDAQFLESRRFQVEEICRFFGVPKHKVMDTERATYSNINQEDLSFYKDTVRPWLTRLEKEFNRVLFDFGDEYFVEFLVDDLLRADTKTRFEVYGIGIQNGLMKINEIRARENLNPVEGGDEILIPLNMQQGNKVNAPAKQEPTQEGGQEEDEDTRRALRELLLDAIQRVSAKEINMLRRYWGKEGLVKRIEEFYCTYEQFVSSNIRSVLASTVKILKKKEVSVEENLASFSRRFVQQRRDKVVWYLEDKNEMDLLKELERENGAWASILIEEVKTI